MQDAVPELARIRELAERGAGFHELINAVRSYGGVSVGQVRRAVRGKRGVYEWFSGDTAPATRSSAERLATYLAKLAARRDPIIEREIGELILAAWESLDNERKRKRAISADANRRRTADVVALEGVPVSGDGLGDGSVIADTADDVAEAADITIADDTAGGPSAGLPRRRRYLVLAAAVAVSMIVAVVWSTRGPAAGPTAAADCHAPGMLPDGSVLNGRSAVRDDPPLDFAGMFGAAWHATRDGVTYRWGRGTIEPGARGVVELRWRMDDAAWHVCAVAIDGDDHLPYRYTPAVPATIDGRPVTADVCLRQLDPPVDPVDVHCHGM